MANDDRHDVDQLQVAVRVVGENLLGAEGENLVAVVHANGNGWDEQVGGLPDEMLGVDHVRFEETVEHVHDDLLHDRVLRDDVAEKKMRLAFEGGIDVVHQQGGVGAFHETADLVVVAFVGRARDGVADDLGIVFEEETEKPEESDAVLVVDLLEVLHVDHGADEQVDERFVRVRLGEFVDHLRWIVFELVGERGQEDVFEEQGFAFERVGFIGAERDEGGERLAFPFHRVGLDHGFLDEVEELLRIEESFGARVDACEFEKETNALGMVLVVDQAEVEHVIEFFRAETIEMLRGDEGVLLEGLRTPETKEKGDELVLPRPPDLIGSSENGQRSNGETDDG